MASQSNMEIEAGEDVAGQFEHAPDGALRWPAPDRDSPQLGTFAGRFSPDEKIGALLQMEGHQGRSEEDVRRITGLDLKRPRRWHKIFERMGIFYPGEGNTRLARLGRLLRDAAYPEGLRRMVTREVLEVLRRYQFDNPVERALPEGCTVHPYWIVLRAASLLDWKIHWDEVNRELMRIIRDQEVDDVVRKIAQARSDPAYAEYIGKESNASGLLSARTHPADAPAPVGKTPEGQLRDQRMTPFLKRVGFGELVLVSPGGGGGGYWIVPTECRDLVQVAVANPPDAKRFATPQEWIEWFCEGTATPGVVVPPPPPIQPVVPVGLLTLEVLRNALQSHEKELVFSDDLLASVVAALRSGDGRNFMILRGVSGTGKSRLVSAIAKAVFGTASVDMPYLTLVEVRPDWTDGSALLGHHDPIAGRYIRTRFLDALLAANECLQSDATNPTPFFVCLDEMNLARVEYYLADCLSAMESGNAIPLDTRGDRTVPSVLSWPRNLFLFGTVNIDESTLRISDKVLDRAQVIDTSDIDLLPQLEKWLVEASALDPDDRQRVALVVGQAWTILRDAGAHFGFRTGRAIVRFVNEAKASSGNVLTIDDAVDIQMVQKVLVKLRGEGERWAQPLTALEEIFGSLAGRRRAQMAATRMRDDLERLGSFQFWN